MTITQGPPLPDGRFERTYSAGTEAEAHAAHQADLVALAEQGFEVHGTRWAKEERRMRSPIFHMSVLYGSERPWTGVRTYPSGTIRVQASTRDEAVAAIAELKLMKKEMALEKRELNAEATAIRSEYSMKVASRGPAVRGSGTTAGLVRGYQRAGRQSDRIEKTEAINDITERKAFIDRRVVEIDRALIALERLAKS